jgi:GNAT superfamily N-acetyltransferase
MTQHAAALEVRDIDLDSTLELRQRVLRGHLPGVPATAPSDHMPDTWHLGAFRDERLVGVLSGFAQEWPERPGEAAERFRFMAVEPSEQGGGVGRALIGELITRARERGVRLLWARGRDSALDFYRRLGFRVVGESFDDEVSRLPHHVVTLDL